MVVAMVRVLVMALSTALVVMALVLTTPKAMAGVMAQVTATAGI